MKTKIVFTSLFLCLMLSTQKGFGVFAAGDDTLVNQTKQAILIVGGKVSSIQYVQPNLNRARVYTDITIAVSKVIKGRPNINQKTVKFRIEGGRGIEPSNGRVFIEEISTTPKFKIGQELILFLQKRTWGDGWAFYDGLYPFVYPPYPTIQTLRENGSKTKVVNFYLAHYKQKYTLDIPVDIAYRLLDNAIKAPEDVTLLENTVRPIKDIRKPGYRIVQVESQDFLSMLKSELTKIETKIKEREARN